MKVIRFDDFSFQPASHEDPQNPGVLKKVLLKHAEISGTSIQMINWALLPKGKSFRAHYHEEMDEIFIMVSGVAEMKINSETISLSKGDGVVVEMREVHTMSNSTDDDIEYIVVGVLRGEGGKTIVVEE